MNINAKHLFLTPDSALRLLFLSGGTRTDSGGRFFPGPASRVTFLTSLRLCRHRRLLRLQHLEGSATPVGLRECAYSSRTKAQVFYLSRLGDCEKVKRHAIASKLLVEDGKGTDLLLNKPKLN